MTKNTQAIFDFIVENPGCTMQEIRVNVFPEKSARQVTQFLTTLRREYNLIENQGRHGLGARWCAVDLDQGIIRKPMPPKRITHKQIKKLESHIARVEKELTAMRKIVANLKEIDESN